MSGTRKKIKPSNNAANNNAARKSASRNNAANNNATRNNETRKSASRRVFRDIRDYFKDHEVIGNIRDYFDNFDFTFLSKPPKTPKEIGRSRNGTVELLTFQKERYVANTIFKRSNNESSDNLAYEAIVGTFINKQAVRFPCFSKTLGLYYYPEEANQMEDYKKMVIDKRSLIFSCEHPLSVGIMLENIRGRTLRQTLWRLTTAPSNFEDFMNKEIIYILYQVYEVLYILSDEFTHNDLDYENVMICNTVADKHIEFNYHYDDRTVSFNSGYLVKIIDYGRSFFQDKQTGYNPRDIYQDLCEAKACKNCGSEHGYAFLDQESVEICSQTRNISNDLRLIHMLKNFRSTNEDLNYLLDNMVFKGHYGTPEIMGEHYGVNCNVHDARRYLEDLIDLAEYKTDYDEDFKLCELHVYSDGRPLEVL